MGGCHDLFGAEEGDYETTQQLFVEEGDELIAPNGRRFRPGALETPSLAAPRGRAAAPRARRARRGARRARRARTAAAPRRSIASRGAALHRPRPPLQMT